MLVDAYRFGGPSPPGSLYDAILALSPIAYYRNAEPSGSTMLNEVGANGSYTGTPVLGSTALYPSGPTSVLTSSGYGKAAVTPVSASNFSQIGIIRFTSLSGFKALPGRDGNSVRIYQNRSNNNNWEIVRINNFGGPTETITATGAFPSTGVSYFFVMTASAAGQMEMYVNNVNVHSQSFTPMNWWQAGDGIDVGFSLGMGSIYSDARQSENAFFDKVLTPTEIATLFTASGL